MTILRKMLVATTTLVLMLGLTISSVSALTTSTSVEPVSNLTLKTSTDGFVEGGTWLKCSFTSKESHFRINVLHTNADGVSERSDYLYTSAKSIELDDYILPEMGKYVVSVRAYRVKDGAKEYSEYTSKAIYVYPKSLETPAITSLKSSPVCMAVIKWKPVKYATGYEIYRSTGSDYTKIKTVEASKSITKVRGINGKSCKYKIRAVLARADGKIVYSPYSAVKSIKTQALMGQANLIEGEKPSGGQAGDQTGLEVRISQYEYSRDESNHYHWDTVIRIKDDEKREKAAAAVEAACLNDYVGYDMTEGQRITLYKEAKKVGWDISKIKTPCETSCTRLICVGINAAGINFPYDIDSFQLKAAVLNTKVTHKAIDKNNRYTGPLTTYDYRYLKNKDEFQVFTTKEYYATYKNLKRGDIICCGEKHTAMILY